MVDSDGDDRRRILAMGGGGFTMSERSPALDRLVLTLTGVPVPKICFLPTASGDGREQTTRFYECFSGWPCQPSILSLFHLARDHVDPTAHLLDQDAIYVGGGSMRNLLAVWREHGIDLAMREAWERGVVLAGLSAGAMCWFEGGMTMSGGAPRPAPGLGLLTGSLSVHLDGEPERLPAYRRAVATGALPAGYAVDDCAALLFAGPRLSACVASRPGARVIGFKSDGQGATVECAQTVRLLPGATPAQMPVAGQEPLAGWEPGAGQAAAAGQAAGAESFGVSELRALRSGRRRWD